MLKRLLTKITTPTISFRFILFLLMNFLFLFVFIFIFILSLLTSVTVQFVVVDFERFEFQYNATLATTTTTPEMKDIMHTVLLLMKVEDERKRKNNVSEERERQERKREIRDTYGHEWNDDTSYELYKSCVVLCLFVLCCVVLCCVVLCLSEWIYWMSSHVHRHTDGVQYLYSMIWKNSFKKDYSILYGNSNRNKNITIAVAATIVKWKIWYDMYATVGKRRNTHTVQYGYVWRYDLCICLVLSWVELSWVELCCVYERMSKSEWVTALNEFTHTHTIN